MAVDRSYVARNNASRSAWRSWWPAAPTAAGADDAGRMDRGLGARPRGVLGPPGRGPLRAMAVDGDRAGGGRRRQRRLDQRRVEATVPGVVTATAADLTVRAAGVVDRLVETLSDEMVTQNVRAGGPLNLIRAEHRDEHLDEIERVLGR